MCCFLWQISIPLMDIALECLTTLQGDVTNIYNITPSESKVETGLVGIRCVYDYVVL